MVCGKKLKGRSIFSKLFGSYLLILGITLVVEMGVSTRVLNTSREQAETLYRSLIQLVKNECDDQIRGIDRNLDLLALDARVQSLSNVRGEFRPDSQYTAYALYDELQSMRFSSEEYKRLFIYFQNTDSVISSAGNMSLEMYHSLYYQELNIPLEELRDYLRQRHYHDIKVLHSKEGTGEIMYSMTSLKTNIGEPSATIAIQITPESIEDRIQTARWDEDIQVAILNSKNESLNNVAFVGGGENLLYEEIPIDKNFLVRLDDQDYIGIAMKSYISDWLYVLLTPKKIIEKDARQIENYCLIGLAVCFVIGFFFAGYFARKNYVPIKGLMDLFRKEHEEAETANGREYRNEYQWLENQTKNFLKQYEDIRRSLDENQRRLRDFCLYKLLTQPYEELDPSERELLNRSGITDGILRVVSLSVGTLPEAQQTEAVDPAREKQTRELKLLIIKSVVEETFNNVFPAELLEMGNSVIALVRLDAMNTDNYDKMWGAFVKSYELIKRDFHFYLQTCAGTAKNGLENVHLSYLEAKETEEYAVLLETFFINYNDIKDRSRKYYYPAEADTRIQYAISVGQPEPAILCVTEILRANYQENRITAKLLPCLIYDLLGTLMRSANETGCSDFFEQYWTNFEDFGNLPRRPQKEIEQQFIQLISALCQEVEKIKNGGDTNLADKIHKYVLENYQDPDLNISRVALYFDKTPAYISSVYKKRTGKGLLKFITQVRIDHAIELLQEGKNVNETAVLSGFRDSRSFIRVFKEQTGLTPGQLKRE